MRLTRRSALAGAALAPFARPAHAAPIALEFTTWQAEEFGLSTVQAEDLRVSGPIESAAKIIEIFAGIRSLARDSVLANSAAALLVAGRVDGLAQGVTMASRAIEDGSAASLLERWAMMSRNPM